MSAPLTESDRIALHAFGMTEEQLLASEQKHGTTKNRSLPAPAKTTAPDPPATAASTLSPAERMERARTQRACNAAMGVSDEVFLRHHPEWTQMDLYCDLPVSEIPADVRREWLQGS